jgi:hypothetical protein
MSLLYHPNDDEFDDCLTFNTDYWQGKIKIFEEKPVSLPFYLLQILHGLP